MWPPSSNMTTPSRLHSAIGHITPHDLLNGLAKTIHDDRDQKLEQARDRRQLARQTAHAPTKSITEEVA